MPGMNLLHFWYDFLDDTSGSTNVNSDITEGDPQVEVADEGTSALVVRAEPTEDLINQDPDQPAASNLGDSEPFTGDELNESMSPLPEPTEPLIEQDLDWPGDNEFDDDGDGLADDWPTGPPTEPPALWYIGNDPTPRTLEYILEHRRTHALERADHALKTSEQFHRAADKMVQDAADQNLEVDEIEVYNVRMEARRYARIGRRRWKILDKQNAEKAAAAAAASSGEVGGPAPMRFTSGKRKRTGGFEARKAKRGCHIKPEDPTAGWAKRPHD